MYRALVSHWQQPETLVLGAHEAPSLLDGMRLERPDRHVIDAMALIDQQTYLPDDILVKVDRAAMANSLETRVPMLDHRVVEFALRLPMQLKLRAGCGKWLLRQVLYRHVPRELIERPKQGFAVPLDQWLRGPLRPWAEHLLDAKRLESQGLLNPAMVCQKWQEHLSGRRNWQYLLWDVLMLQAWLEAA
jgi:asparagine synthase (glutamine-hydrolysing)